MTEFLCDNKWLMLLVISRSGAALLHAYEYCDTLPIELIGNAEARIWTIRPPCGYRSSV